MKSISLKIMYLPVILGICLLLAKTSHAAEGLILEASINGKPVRLLFNTASEKSFLFAKSAKRLGLKWTEPSPDKEPLPGSVWTGRSEECLLSMGGSSIRSRIPIYKEPTNVKFPADGVIGWPGIKSLIVKIDGAKKSISPLKELPLDIDRWEKWTVDPEYNLLVIKTDADTSILINASSDSGVSLSPKRWKEWRENLKEPIRTLNAYNTTVGVKVCETCWAKTLSLGKLSLVNIPVEIDPSRIGETIKNYAASVGILGLRRLEVIIDAKNGAAYTRAIVNPDLDISYNRIGAVFVPVDGQSNDLVAHVIEGSPAYKSGIRKGDILTKIEGLDATKWRTDPKILPLSQFWNGKPGTLLNLQIRRGEKIHQMTVPLVEIFPITDR